MMSLESLIQETKPQKLIILQFIDVQMKDLSQVSILYTGSDFQRPIFISVGPSGYYNKYIVISSEGHYHQYQFTNIYILLYHNENVIYRSNIFSCKYYLCFKIATYSKDNKYPLRDMNNGNCIIRYNVYASLLFQE